MRRPHCCHRSMSSVMSHRFQLTGVSFRGMHIEVESGHDAGILTLEKALENGTF